MPLKHRSSSRNAVLVGSGILLSRIIGLVRERIFAHYFGNSDAADAFKAALKIPNLLQNLFGEGALSSSFIPVYANLLASGQRRRGQPRRPRNRLHSRSGHVPAGPGGSPGDSVLIDLIAPGFKGLKRDSTIRMVRIMFPGVGILVLSAWCLGILNSHRRFFLPYAAPVLWNLAMIAALVGFGGRMQSYPSGRDRGVGIRCRKRSCNSRCRFPRSYGSPDASAFRLDTVSVKYPDGHSKFHTGRCQPRRQPA